MSAECRHGYPIDGDGSPGDRCHDCIADEGFDEARNALAKAARFQWDATTKSWRRKVFVDELKSFPFEIRQVA